MNRSWVRFPQAAQIRPPGSGWAFFMRACCLWSHGCCGRRRARLWGRAARCARGRRPVREIATREPAARSGRSRGPPWPCHRPPAPRPGPAFCSSPVPSGPSGAHGHRSLAIRPLRCSPHGKRWGFCSIRSWLAGYLRRVAALMMQFPPFGGGEFAVCGGVVAKLQTHWVKRLQKRLVLLNGSAIWRNRSLSWCVVRASPPEHVPQSLVAHSPACRGINRLTCCESCYTTVLSSNEAKSGRG